MDECGDWRDFAGANTDECWGESEFISLRGATTDRKGSVDSNRESSIRRGRRRKRNGS